MLILARQQRYTNGMYYVEVAPNRIVRTGSDVFTYASETPLGVGTIVRVPVGSSSSIGVVMRTVKKPDFATKAVLETILDTPLPQPLLRTITWMADYYATPLATVLQTILPRGVDKKRRPLKATTPLKSVRERTTIVLNKDQQRALEIIQSGEPKTAILQGITGSGKTEVYKALARSVVAKKKSVIVLVPEISLTSQIVAEFQHDFPNVIVTHSHMTEAQRHAVWLEALTSSEPRVVIGPRSALFLPLQSVGAIVVDEAHEPSYKQEQSPRYSALRTATMLGKYAKAPVVFGSATPSIVDRYLAEVGGHDIIRLDMAARANRRAPNTTVIDMTNKDNRKHHQFLSDPLLRAIEVSLSAGEQTLLFHNRRGSAATTLCEQCGWSAHCPRCFVPLTLHTDHFQLVCHICDLHTPVPTHCPVCESADIIHKGVGTKRIEAEIRKKFPKARVARFDSDNRKDETVQSLYNELYEGNIDIAIGTQVVAKGLDLPHLRTVGVIQADSGLALPDFAAAERAFQLIAQVVGRVGRNEHTTSVIVQTYQPTHPAIQFGVAQSYDAFYDWALSLRKKGHFPPYTHLLRLTAVYKTEKGAVSAAKRLAAELKPKLHTSVQLMGPTPAFYERRHDTYRWQLILKSPRREHLLNALQHVPTTHWQSELDPTSLI